MKILAGRGDFSIPKGGISTVETISIGGIKQTILIQSASANKPVLLLVHGGPSMPLPGVACRNRDYTLVTTTKELIKHYTVVFWDQRGTGKSYHADIPKESMNVDQFVSDCLELTDYLRDRFQQEKIVLSGHSWGTVIALQAAYEHPEKFHAYVGLSQIVNWTENDRLCLEWVLEEAKHRGDRKAVATLEALGQPPYLKDTDQWGVLRKYLMKYSSMIYTDEQIKHPGLKYGFKVFLHSPDYSLRDIFHSFYSGGRLTYTQRMIEDFARIDFIKTAPKMEIPLYFVHGQLDVHVYGELLEEYVTQVDAQQGKNVHWLPKSSHIFHPDDAREVERIFIEEVLLDIVNKGQSHVG